MSKVKEESKKEKDKQLLGVEYELELRDRDGKLLELRREKSHTWVRNFIRFLYNQFMGRHQTDRTFTALDTGGTSRTVWAYRGSTSGFVIPFGARAGAGADSYGIQVGLSDAPFSRDQFSLQSRISHGTGVNQMLYGDVTIEDVALEDSTERFRIIRAFTNNSGSPITVREIGITVMNQIDGATFYTYLFCRDVLPSPITVPDGASLTVRYRIFVSYA